MVIWLNQNEFVCGSMIKSKNENLCHTNELDFWVTGVHEQQRTQKNDFATTDQNYHSFQMSQITIEIFSCDKGAIHHFNANNGIKFPQIIKNNQINIFH